MGFFWGGSEKQKEYFFMLIWFSVMSSFMPSISSWMLLYFVEANRFCMPNISFRHGLLFSVAIGSFVWFDLFNGISPSCRLSHASSLKFFSNQHFHNKQLIALNIQVALIKRVRELCTITIHSSHSLFLVGHLDSIQCLHRANVCKFLLDGQQWCNHV